MNDFRKAKNIIKKSDSIIILTHILPDSDAVCSAQIVKSIVNNVFHKDCELGVDGEISDLLKPFTLGTNFEPSKEFYDLVIVVDCPNIYRTGQYISLCKKAKHIINIDHHISNEKFGDVNVVEIQSSSTSEILFNICYKHFRKTINIDICKLTYSGIITDTNCLMSNNITSKTYETIAKLYNFGLQLDLIRNYFFKSYSKEKVSFMGETIKNIQILCNGKVGLLIIPYESLKSNNMSFEDTLGLSEYTIRISEVEIGITLIEKQPKTYYVSLRSKRIDVSKIAGQMGGGGHELMAAFQFKGDQNVELNKLIQVCEKELSTDIIR